MNASDDKHLRRAIELAAHARATGEQPYGSVLTDGEGTVLAEDWNTVVSGRDITAHPELKLARWAGRELAAEQARRATLFTSCQPCGMCSNAISRSQIGRVVFALDGAALQALKPAGAAAPDAAEVLYEGPALIDEARQPVAGYYG